MENKIQKIGKFYQVITKHGDVISKRYKTRKGAEDYLLKICFFGTYFY